MCIFMVYSVLYVLGAMQYCACMHGYTALINEALLYKTLGAVV